MNNSTYTFLGGLLMAVQLGAGAQQHSAERSLTAQPSSYDIESKRYEAKGYGHARFGMAVAEVSAVVAADFPAALASMKDETDPAQHTRALAIVVPDLAPGPGRATVTYVFGARSERLIAVNVYWQFDGVATPAQQAQLTTAAAAIASGLVGYQWPLFTLTRGSVLAPGVLIVFAAKDDAGGGVEVRLDGVPFDVVTRAASTTTAALLDHRTVPAGPARLKLSIVANVDHPDFYRKP